MRVLVFDFERTFCEKGCYASSITPFRRHMHEISLVRNIFKTLEDEFPGEIQNVRGIHLTVGLLSNIQPILMQNAFIAVLEDEPIYNKTTLHVVVLPVLIHCDDCNKTTEVLNYKFACSCGKPSRNIVQGEELLISKVEFPVRKSSICLSSKGIRETSAFI